MLSKQLYRQEYPTGKKTWKISTVNLFTLLAKKQENQQT